MAIVEFKDVTRVYTSGDHELRALDGVNLSLEEGQFIVVLGPSGAGKSTLLNLLGGLDSPTSGRILVNGQDISGYSGDTLAEYRASSVGFVSPKLTVKSIVAESSFTADTCTSGVTGVMVSPMVTLLLTGATCSKPPPSTSTFALTVTSSSV